MTNNVVVIAKYTVILFGLFIICVGALMLFAPKRARETLGKMASTNLINYTEITLRIIPAVGLIVYADFSKYPLAFKGFGWLMLGTSIVLYIIPRKWHHAYSRRSAEILKPLYFQLLSPVAFLIGTAIIYCVF